MGMCKSRIFNGEKLDFASEIDETDETGRTQPKLVVFGHPG